MRPAGVPLRLVPLLLACCCWPLAAQELLRPAQLAPEGASLERILTDLLSGEDDADSVGTADPAVFTSPLTTGRADDHAVVRHWQAAFLARLADLAPPRRERLVAALDRLARQRGTDPAAAMRLLPAPAAVARLSSAADRAFDRGRLRDYLAIAAVLDPIVPQWESAPGRRAAAHALLGLTSEAGDPLHLDQPGPLVARSALAPGIDLEAGITVVWRVAHDHLLACDPWQQVRWQRPLEPRARVAYGAGAAAIRGERSLVVLDEDGHGIERPLAPAVRLLGVRDGAAWLAVGRSVHAIAPDGRVRDGIELEAEPTGPPLVQGERSLWLTATTLEFRVGRELVLRSRHGLPQGDWRLVLTREGPAVTDGRVCHAIGAPHPGAHPPARWFEHLVRAGRADAALDQPPAGLAPELLALARLVAARDGDALTVARAVGDPALDLQLALRGHGGWSAASTDPAVIALANAHPRLLLPGPEEDPRDHPDHWRHVVAAATLAPQPPVLGTALGPARPSPAAAPTPVPQRHPSLGAVQLEDGLLLRVRQDQGAIVASVHAADGALRWRQRFEAAGFFLPTVGIALVGDAVLVAEGQSRVRIFDRRFGLPRGQLRKPVDLPLRALVPLADGSACHLAEVGGRRALRLISGDETRQLPVTDPRWVAPIAGGAAIATADGAIRWPGGDALAWPQDLVAGEPPQVGRDGLWRDGWLWPWVP